MESLPLSIPANRDLSSSSFPTLVIGNPATLVIPDIFNRESLWVFTDGHLQQTRRYDKRGIEPRYQPAG